MICNLSMLTHDFYLFVMNMNPWWKWLYKKWFEGIFVSGNPGIGLSVGFLNYALWYLAKIPVMIATEFDVNPPAGSSPLIPVEGHYYVPSHSTFKSAYSVE
jgi:hypothetical protein